MSIPKTLQKYADRISYVDDERRDDNGWWVGLKDGWQDRYNPQCHTVHEDTLKECATIVKNAVPCTCDECTNALAKVTA